MLSQARASPEEERQAEGADGDGDGEPTHLRIGTGVSVKLSLDKFRRSKTVKLHFTHPPKDVKNELYKGHNIGWVEGWTDGRMSTPALLRCNIQGCIIRPGVAVRLQYTRFV